MSKSLALLSIGFRPFFILASLIAIVNPFLWTMHNLGHLSLPLNTSLLFWHGHEMIFGFSGALIAGFILTASSNWTGTVPYQGKALLLLVSLWILERVSYLFPVSEAVHFVLMNLFLPVFVFMLAKKLWASPKQRNVFIPLLLTITFAKAMHSYGYFFDNSKIELFGRELAAGLIRFLLLLIAGRVLPFFTKKRISGIEINVPDHVSQLAIISLLMAAIAMPLTLPIYLEALILIFAIVCNTWRFILWKPLKTIKVPILFILHAGIFFILLSMVQELIGLYRLSMHNSKATLHLLMAGGMSVVGLGIMSRVSLGHTGRSIVADKLVQLSYLLVALGAMIRVFVPILLSDYYTVSLYYSSAIWCLGFVLFFVRFIRLLVSPRPDGKEY